MAIISQVSQIYVEQQRRQGVDRHWGKIKRKGDGGKLVRGIGGRETALWEKTETERERRLQEHTDESGSTW